jgi:2-hydroxychromene-2-carboxylate isomerase
LAVEDLGSPAEAGARPLRNTLPLHKPDEGRKMQREDVKMYSDYKSPYAWLAFDSAFALESRYAVKLWWKPFQLRLKGSGQRSLYSEYKVRYSYMDARRTANERGGKMVIRGPLKIYDTAPALIGGLFAEKHGKLVEYSRRVYELFFNRELAADELEAIIPLIDELGLSGKDYKDYFGGEGQRDYENAQADAAADHVFGVPIFIFRGEQFWGNDRIPMLERRLDQSGLLLEKAKQTADALSAGGAAAQAKE